MSKSSKLGDGFMRYSATNHSINRAKERRNFKNQRAAERNIALAIKNGKRADDLSSWEREFLLGEERDGCSAIAYNKFCYIVNSENVCITMYPLPVWFGKKKRFDGKERIRDYKKYQKIVGEEPKFDEFPDEDERDKIGSVDCLIASANNQAKAYLTTATTAERDIDL